MSSFGPPSSREMLKLESVHQGDQRVGDLNSESKIDRNGVVQPREWKAYTQSSPILPLPKEKVREKLKILFSLGCMVTG